jgi:hypothetical protein
MFSTDNCQWGTITKLWTELEERENVVLCVELYRIKMLSFSYRLVQLQKNA